MCLPKHPHQCNYLIAAVAMIFVFLCGCAGTIKSEGSLHKLNDDEYHYQYAAVMPNLRSDITAALESTLAHKGYFVYRHTIFDIVQTITLDTPILVIEAYENGITNRLSGYSQKVECRAFDLHTNKTVYEGFGEAIGWTVADDMQRATIAALHDLPTIGSSGQISSSVDVDTGRSGDSQGTSWHVGLGYLVTCSHVVDDSMTITAYDQQGVAYEAVLVASDRANDLAILRIISDYEGLAAIPIASKQLAVGMEVFTLGFPMADLLGDSIKYSSGVINSIKGLKNDPRVYQISVPVQIGNSGAPLINQRGEVVAIVTSKLDAVAVWAISGDMPQNVNYAIRVQYLIPLLASLKIDNNDITYVDEHNSEQLIERLSASVLKIIAK